MILRRIGLGCLSLSRTTSHHSRRFLSRSSIPPEFEKTYHLSGSTTPGNRSGVSVKTNTGHSIQTDVPRGMGGHDTAPQPVETLLAAWMGCTQATALFVGRHMEPRLLLDRLEFDIVASRDERGALQLPLDAQREAPSRLQRVGGIITVYLRKGTISVEQIKVLSEQTEERCPVANMMIASGCEMAVEWVAPSTE